MWFERMVLEIWFDDHQYEVTHDIGESAVQFKTVNDLNLDLNPVELRYGYHYGRPDLRAAVAELYPGFQPEETIVTVGAAEAIFTINSALMKPGDHCIVEHPNYPSLYTIPRGLGVDTSLFTLRFEDDFKPDLDRLEALIRPETKLISFTHPNNPTGSMISADELERLVEIAARHKVYLMFDETYREMDADNKLPPAATLGDHVISVSTMSKSFGLPGIRVGWAACRDKDLLDKLLVVREHTSITNTSLGEEIALNVLNRAEDILPAHRRAIADNKENAMAWIGNHDHVEWVYPEVGVVAFPRLKSHVAVEPEELFRHLVARYKTFVIPGRCFEMEDRHFRLGFGAEPEELKQGLANFDAALADLM